MKVYLAMSGDSYEDARIEGVFTSPIDAEQFELGEWVDEYELQEGPAEVRTWYQMRWYSDAPLDPVYKDKRARNPVILKVRRIYDGQGDLIRTWWPCATQVEVQGWDLDLVRAEISRLIDAKTRGDL